MERLKQKTQTEITKKKTYRLCRVCLIFSIEFVDLAVALKVEELLFDAEEVVTYQECFQYSTQLTIDITDNICINCGRDLLVTYAFLRKAHKSDEHLKRCKSIAKIYKGKDTKLTKENILNSLSEPAESSGANNSEINSSSAGLESSVESIDKSQTNPNTSKVKKGNQLITPVEVLNVDKLLVGKQENREEIKTKPNLKRTVQNKCQKQGLSVNCRKRNTKNENTKLIAKPTITTPPQIDLSEALQLHVGNDIITVSAVDNNDDEKSILDNDLCQTEQTDDSNRDDLDQPPAETIAAIAICKICKKSINNGLELNEHNETVHGRLLQCSMCAFNGKEYIVVEHMKEVHAGLDTVVYKCEKCEKTFSTNDECQIHQLQQHALKDTTKDQVKTNMTIDVENNKHANAMQCTVCERFFSTTQELAEHTHLHTGVRPYLCLYCHLSYTTRAKYNTHLRNMHDMVLNSQDFDQLCLQTLLNESTQLYRPCHVSDEHAVLLVESEECDAEFNTSETESDMFVSVDPEIEMEIGENEIHF